MKNSQPQRFIRIIRRLRGWTQAYTAGLCQVSQPAIHDVEQLGYAGPDLRQRLERHFDAPWADLVAIVPTDH